MRSLRFPLVAACATLLVLPSFAVAQDEDENKPRRAPRTSLTQRDVNRIADAVAKRLAEEMGEELAEMVAEKVVEKMGGAAKAAGPDAEIRQAIADLIDQTEPEARREAIQNFFDEQWPQGEPVDAYAAEIAGTLGFLGRQLPDEAAYESFVLAAELATRALESGNADDDAKEAFGQVFYNAACVHALEGEKDEAIADLDRAFEYGFSDIALLTEDEDLDGLRELDVFKERVVAWEKAAREAALAEAKEALSEGETFPLEFTYTDVDGKEHTLADYKGQVVIVDFWGTWCPPCRAEIPSFIKLQDEYGKQGLQILGLNYNDEEEEIVEYVDETGINYPTGLGDEETQDMVPNFRGFPTTVFIGRDGKVKLQVVGLHEYYFLEAVVSELLAEEVVAEEAAEKADEVQEKTEADAKDAAE
ncbi:MAG: TlpA disulfide reductase family protein [Planctomycetota bacterium]